MKKKEKHGGQQRAEEKGATLVISSAWAAG